MFFTLLPMIKIVLLAEIKTLNIMGLLPMSGEKWSGGGACLTAAEMALRHVNGRNDVLKDFKLDLHWRDGEVRHSYFLCLIHYTRIFAYVYTKQIPTCRESESKNKMQLFLVNSSENDR